MISAFLPNVGLKVRAADVITYTVTGGGYSSGTQPLQYNANIEMRKGETLTVNYSFDSPWHTTLRIGSLFEQTIENAASGTFTVTGSRSSPRPQPKRTAP